MPKVFQTQDEGAIVEIVGLGVLHPGATGPGITVEDAASVLVELQVKDSYGASTGVPLEGEELADAAVAFADARGLRVFEMSDARREAARRALGFPADRPPAVEIAEQDYRMTYDHQPVNNNPGALTFGGSQTGVLDPPSQEYQLAHGSGEPNPTDAKSRRASRSASSGAAADDGDDA